MKLYVLLWRGVSGTWYPCALSGRALVEDEWNLIEWYDSIDKVPQMNSSWYHILELEV